MTLIVLHLHKQTTIEPGDHLILRLTLGQSAQLS